MSQLKKPIHKWIYKGIYTASTFNILKLYTFKVIAFDTVKNLSYSQKEGH